MHKTLKPDVEPRSALLLLAIPYPLSVLPEERVLTSAVSASCYCALLIRQGIGDWAGHWVSWEKTDLSPEAWLHLIHSYVMFTGCWKWAPGEYEPQKTMVFAWSKLYLCLEQSVALSKHLIYVLSEWKSEYLELCSVILNISYSFSVFQ